MKVISAKEMARIEKLSYAQGASEDTFMEKAGEGVAIRARQLIGKLHLKPKIVLLCGKGNNAGDALVAGRHLLNADFEVSAFCLSEKRVCSPLAQKNWDKFVSAKGTIILIKKIEEADFQNYELIIDGIFGTGFEGTVDGLLKEVITKANETKIPILSIDIPSGVNGTTSEVANVAIQAKETLFLGLPKTGCFLGNAWNHVGHIHVFDFGLKEEFIAQAKEDFFLLEQSDIKPLFPKMTRSRHKYEAGYVVGIGGSPGMPGAAILASYAALKSGAGIVRLFHPMGMEAELSSAPFEIIRVGYKEGDYSSILKEVKRAKALFIGPGIGVSQEAINMLKTLLPAIDKPCVIDAEALTLIGAHNIPLPSQAILTPHHGEMLRLLQTEKKGSIFELLTACQTYAQERNVVLVLKGSPTFIFSKNASPFISSHGDPGMATAGSGDVLTGIIAAFLAQGKNVKEAAQLGVFLHGLAGECAANKLTSYSLVASDITNSLPEAIQNLIEDTN